MPTDQTPRLRRRKAWATSATNSSTLPPPMIRLISGTGRGISRGDWTARTSLSSVVRRKGGHPMEVRGCHLASALAQTRSV